MTSQYNNNIFIMYVQFIYLRPNGKLIVTDIYNYL